MILNPVGFLGEKPPLQSPSGVKWWEQVTAVPYYHKGREKSREAAQKNKSKS
ncbi:MAG: hypothetical protein FWG34_12380 [Oscillospiraceae bacterium]|nr:hypothetical protein [Oscillospiraceae bacterium]